MALHGARSGRCAPLIGAAVAAVLLAACAEQVDGNPVPGSIASSSAAITGFPSGSPSISLPSVPLPSPTSSATTTVPSTTVPSTTGPSTGGSLRRTPVATTIGDPVTKDFCLGQGTSALRPLGYDVSYSPVQYGSGCTFRLKRNGQIDYDVFEFANPPATAPKRSGGTTTTVGGFRVHKSPFGRSSSSCDRDVTASGIVVTIQSFAISGSRTSALICKAGDAAALGMTRFLGKGTAVPDLPLHTPSVFNLDLCRIADAAGLSTVPVLTGATAQSLNFGAECYLSSKKVSFYVDVAVVDPAKITSKYRAVEVGSHRVLASTTNDKSYCGYSVRQNSAGSGGSYEEIDISMTATDYSNPPPQLCAGTLQAIGKYLDAGGLK